LCTRIFAQVPAKKQKVEESVPEVKSQNGHKDDSRKSVAKASQEVIVADDVNEDAVEDEITKEFEQVIIYARYLMNVPSQTARISKAAIRAIYRGPHNILLFA